MTLSHIAPAEGCIAAPDAPGLGIEVNPDALRKFLVEVELKVGGERLFATPELL